MNKTISLALSVLSLALLQACGGGGGDSGGTSVTTDAGTDVPSTQTTPITSPNTGSVSAPFSRGTTARYQLVGVSRQSVGVLDTSVQDASGAMTTLGTNVLSGDIAVKEISGDASYAMGRWTAGTVTTRSGASTLSGTGNDVYHYLTINLPTAFPTSGTFACDAGVFTAPTYASGAGSATVVGSATGSASLSFGTGGATVTGAINVTASGSSGSASLNGSVSEPSSATITGAYFSNGAGAYVQIGDGGAGSYLVATSFVAVLANGAHYIGVAKFRCS